MTVWPAFRQRVFGIWRVAAEWTAAALGLTVALMLAAAEAKGGLANLNVVTWVIMLALDVAGLLLIIRGGYTFPPIQWAWTLAATIVVIGIAINLVQDGTGTWSFGMIEVAALIGCVIAGYFWYRAKTKRTEKDRQRAVRTGLICFMVASFVGFAPQLVDYWYRPAPDTWYIWVLAGTACCLGIIGAPKKDFAHIGTQSFYVALNIVTLALVRM